MPTVIHFVGRDQVLVREDEDQVRDAFAASDGLPAALTHHRSGDRVFVNLGQVTFWRSRAPRDATPPAWPALDRVPTAS